VICDFWRRAAVLIDGPIASAQPLHFSMSYAIARAPPQNRKTRLSYQMPKWMGALTAYKRVMITTELTIART
jgi:hypothetical protein